VIAGLVNLLKHAVLAHFVADSFSVLMPNPNVLFVHEKFALMARQDIAKKRAPKRRLSINQVALGSLTARLGVRLLAQNT